MRNKKLFAGLVMSSLCMVLSPLASNAMTLGIGTPEGSRFYHYYEVPKENTAEKQPQAGEDTAGKQSQAGEDTAGKQFQAEENAAGKQTQAEEAAEKQVRAEKQQLKESLAWLEPFGVTYDVEKNSILYEGKTVRYLIDERETSGGSYIYSMPEGQVDLYTIRDQEGAATGVREATEEEYRKNSELVSGAVDSGETAIAAEIEPGIVREGTGTIIVTDQETGAQHFGEIYEVAVADAQCEASGISASDLELERQKEEEYERIGITRSENGDWIWNGKKVYFILDGNGGMYVNGSVAETEKELVYLFISRDEDGKAVKAESVTGKGILEKMAE